MGGGGRSQLHHSIVTNFPSSPNQHRRSPQTATPLGIRNRPLCPPACVSLGKFLNLSGPSVFIKSGVWTRCSKGPSSSVLLTMGDFQLSHILVHCTLLMFYGFQTMSFSPSQPLPTQAPYLRCLQQCECTITHETTVC